jgi:16S rRNA (guanine(966)-N(2))-methyltransferase RsmD
MSGRGASAPAVRVLAGRWKGRRLDAPPAARPTSGRARQALLNLLADRVAGARVLDLYAGTGAVGIEMVSRGSASAVLVEPDAAALRRCLERIGASPEEVRVVAMAGAEAVAELARKGERFDVVFADPPYAERPGSSELEGVASLLADGGVFVLQQDARTTAPQLQGLALRDRRAYGRNVFFFFEML